MVAYTVAAALGAHRARRARTSAATLPAVILANRLRMTRCCAQNERVVFTNKLSITSMLVIASFAPRLTCDKVLSRARREVPSKLQAVFPPSASLSYATHAAQKLRLSLITLS